MSPALAGRFFTTSATWKAPLITFTFPHLYSAFLVAQTVKRLPAMRETWFRFLDQEDPLDEGNGNPLQHACLENPMDGGT